MTNTVISMDDLAQAPVLDGDVAYQIADYLEDQLVRYGILEGKQLELPGLFDLASLLRARQMVVHEAFQILRRRGFDYAISGIKTPLLFWKYPASQKVGQML